MKQANSMSVKELAQREALLEDVLDSLVQERNFALRTQDWPRVGFANERIKETKDRLWTVAAALAVR